VEAVVDVAQRSARRRGRFVTTVAVGSGVAFVAVGIWAMVDPRGFFDAVATFDPYNPHLLQDIGAFQIGLGAVLLLAAWLADGLAAALLGVGVGGLAHTASHVVGRDLGGTPETDIPFFAIASVLLLAAGARALSSRPRPGRG
jgi:hypothetical protein